MHRQEQKLVIDVVPKSSSKIFVYLCLENLYPEECNILYLAGHCLPIVHYITVTSIKLPPNCSRTFCCSNFANIVSFSMSRMNSAAVSILLMSGVLSGKVIPKVGKSLRTNICNKQLYWIHTDGKWQTNDISEKSVWKVSYCHLCEFSNRTNLLPYGHI